MPRAAASKASNAQWRAVEAQHVVSTMALVDTLAEQELLEEILESAKPDVPNAARGLHYLLATPFRYPSPFGSRFRRPYEPGVLYGATAQRTACAELGYWRWRFLQDSPGLTQLQARPQTVFQFSARGVTRDLRRSPYVARRDAWTHPHDYTACRQMADESRLAGVQIIRYQSVRDPEGGGCSAVLDPGAIAPPAPSELQTWYLLVRRERVRWWSEDRTDRVAFDFETEGWWSPAGNQPDQGGG